MENFDPGLLTDRELVETLLEKGAEWAFRELYRRHTPRLLHLVQRISCGTSSDAEDLTQETWLRATRGLADFRWESAFGTWICGIGVNVSRDHLRKRARRKEVKLTAVPDPRSASPRSLLRDARLFDIERALARLPEGYRTVLVLHDIEGFTHGEIARLLEISTGTSKSQLTWGRRALRSLLEGPTEADNERQMA